MASSKSAKAIISFRKGLVSVDDPLKSPEESILAGENFRIEELGSVSVRDGYVSKIVIPSGMQFVGMYEDRVKRTPVISDGTSVYALESSGWALVGVFPQP